MPFGLSIFEIVMVIAGFVTGFALLLFLGVIIVRTVLRFSEGLRGESSGPQGG